MKCKAIKKAYYNKHLVEVGQEVNIKEDKLPSWAIPKVEPEPVVTNDIIESAVEDNLEQLRAKAKELGYKYYRNAGKVKLQKYVAKHSK